jgi:hypothetical protein
VIRDETKRVRQPAAWLLLAGVTISVFLGLMAMLSTNWAAAANAGTLLALAGNAAGPTFADRSVVATHVFTALPVTAMAVVAVILATHLGEKVSQARRITLFAVILQGTALLFGVITWLVALGVSANGSAKLGFFLDGAIGIVVAVAGLFFSTVTLRSRELQAARPRPAAQPASPAGYPGYSYGPQATGAAGVGGGYATTPTYGSGLTQTPQPPGQQTPSQQASQPTAQYPTSTSQQYGPAAGTYGQQSYGSYEQQASGQQGYSAGYGQQSYQQGYDSGYGQQAAYGQNYGSYGQGYGQQAQPESYQQPSADGFGQAGTSADSYTEGYQQSAQPPAETYQQPSAETYQQYYQQSHRQMDHGGSENSQPGHSADDGDSRDAR